MLLEEYLQKKRREKWSTRQWRQRAFAQWVGAIGDSNVGRVGVCDVEDFEAALFDQGLSPNTVRSYLKALGPVFKYAQRRGYRQSDPFEGFRLPRAVDGGIRIYGGAEVRSLLTAAGRLWQARIMLAVSAGLRRSEVLNLTVSDIDFERQLLTVQAKKETAATWAWTPKGYEPRTLALTAEAGRLLSAILVEDVPAGQPYLLLDEKRYWDIQQLRKAGRMTDRQRLCPDENFSPAFRRIRRQARIELGTFHDLRRTCITVWSWHLPVQEVRKMAGHASIETTMRYYLGIRADVLDRTRQIPIGATGLEPATS
jgi:integrase